MNLKGTLPVLILQVLSEGERYGYAIAQDIKQRSRGVLGTRRTQVRFRASILAGAAH